MVFDPLAFFGTKPVNYRFSVNDVDICRKFSSDLGYGVDEYCSRGGVGANKVRRDILVGKLREIIACKSLRVFDLEVTDPDFKIYPIEEKSFDADLVVDGKVNVHVKSCDLSNGFTQSMQTASWIFNRSNSQGTGGLDTHCLGDGSAECPDWVCFVVVNSEDLWGSISYVVNVKSLHDHKLFSPPALDNKRQTKLAVYAHRGNGSVFSGPINVLSDTFETRLDTPVLDYIMKKNTT